MSEEYCSEDFIFDPRHDSNKAFNQGSVEEDVLGRFRTGTARPVMNHCQTPVSEIRFCSNQGPLERSHRYWPKSPKTVVSDPSRTMSQTKSISS